MKALYLYFHMVLFVVKILANEIWTFGRNLPLATFGSERVKVRSPRLPLISPLRALSIC